MTVTIKSETMPICDCCKRAVTSTGSKPFLIGCDAMLCKDCWHEWYDMGITDPIKLGKHVLNKFGKYGEKGGVACHQFMMEGI